MASASGSSDRDFVFRVIRNCFITVLFLSMAFFASNILIRHTGSENNSALVFVLAVALISLLTKGYAYGILASLVGTFCINYFFMYPYAAFSLSLEGYPIATISMVTISCVVCALTARVKIQAVEAQGREEKTRQLYEQNAVLSEEKNRMQMQKEREEIRSNILRAVSHDLRTPLTSISGAAAVLLSGKQPEERDYSLLSDIKYEADDLIVLVENLLSITRLHEGTMQLNKQNELLEEVAADAIIKIRRRYPNCEISMELTDDILYPKIDVLLIKQVIINLLENAIRHSGDVSQISLSLKLNQYHAEVEVRDHGCGLSPEICKLIAAGTPLPRSTGGDSSRGMGIGLSVCQSIIQAHDGYFRAGNAPDGGAFFCFGLPIE